jgi:membrane protein DedA with SNARE-associated domain
MGPLIWVAVIGGLAGWFVLTVAISFVAERVLRIPHERNWRPSQLLSAAAVFVWLAYQLITRKP